MSKARKPLGGPNLSGEVDAETLADLTRLAEHMKCTVDHLVATAVHRFVNDEIGAITPDEFAHLPRYQDPSPTARALDKAEDKARAALRAYIKVGEDAADRGELISQEEMERWFAARISARSRAIAAE